MIDSPRIHLLVPAAGVGSRAGSTQPKQYQPLAGHAMVTHTLRALVRVRGVHSLNVVVSPDDLRMQSLMQSDPALSGVRVWPVGGETRAASVSAGLHMLSQSGAQAHDWVLVHDAARCLIQPQWVEELISACRTDPVGGLLAIPLPDTLKQANDQQRVSASLSRTHKWLAQTPQMFRLGPLGDALAQAGLSVTDEASAVEALGLQPRLVPGSTLNFKVTYPEDLRLAALVLSAKEDLT